MTRFLQARTGPTLLAILLAGAAGVQAESTPPPTTLAELARLALATNESVERADSQLRRAQADVRLTSSALLPRLELNGAWTRYGSAQTLEFAPGEEFEIRPLSDWSWSADLRQTLFYGLRDWRARDVARLRRDIAELERVTTAQDLVLEVARSFFTAVAADERVAVRRTALEQISAQLDVARRRYQVGEITSADVARWEAELAAARQQLIVAEGDTTLAKHRLARLTGATELGDLEPPGRVPVPDGSDAQLVGRALENRLEIATLDHQMEAAGLMIRVEKGAWLPEVEAHAQYFQQKSIFPSQDWTSLALTLKVPIYDGGLTAARVAQAREDLREIELLSQEVHKAVADQVDAAAIGHRAAAAALEAARERRDAAREAHRQVEKAYRVGEASATDLLETTTALTDAETSFVIARAQLGLQAISLRRALGEPPLPDLDIERTVAEEEDPS